MVLMLAGKGTDAPEVLLKAVERNKHNYGNALCRFVIINDQHRSAIHSGRIDFLHKDTTVQSEIQQYDRITLLKEVITVDHAVRIIQNMAKKEPIKLNNTDFNVEGDFDTPSYVPSKKNWGYVKHEWPHTHSFYMLKTDVGIDATIYNSLVKPKLPAYPDFNEAVMSFLDLKPKQYDMIKRIIIVIPDYRARITAVQLSSNKVTLEIDSKEPEVLKNAIGKFYLAGDDKDSSSEDIPVKDFSVSCACDFQPVIIDAYLITSTGDRLDYREVNIYAHNIEDLQFETEALAVEELIRRGESQTVEFKQEISDNTLAETVVAFANSDGGVIIVGVDHNSKAVGFRQELSRAKDSISNTIGSLCEPPPNLDFEIVDLEGNIPVLLITVIKGDDRPYLLRDRGIFVRRNATNRQITRLELDEFYKKDRTTASNAVW